MLKNALTNGVLVGAMLMWATVASAQDLGRQTVNFTLGYFTPVGFDGRDLDDVLSANSTFLLFDIDDFNGASVGGEWLFPLARHIEGGDLGFVHRGQLIEEFERALHDLKPGGVSPVVQTLFGFHLLRLVDVRPAAQKTFAEVKATIVRDLTETRCAEQAAAWSKRLRSAARIVVGSGEIERPPAAVSAQRR